MLITDIRVDTQSRQLHAGSLQTACALGRGGVRPAHLKQEGDGATPLGRYALERVYWRADRLARPITGLPIQALTPSDGWCDAPEDPAYNCFITHPYPASAERLWREDGLYDIIVTLSHNSAPVVPGLGSAIFLHCATIDAKGALEPTLGCIAVPRATLGTLLGTLGARSWIEIV
jgi:L,D-peptidoglycan transpeptidase YkuD (ErfK/YbiS/YcfS/YnhG family)